MLTRPRYCSLTQLHHLLGCDPPGTGLADPQGPRFQRELGTIDRQRAAGELLAGGDPTRHKGRN